MHGLPVRELIRLDHRYIATGSAQPGRDTTPSTQKKLVLLK